MANGNAFGKLVSVSWGTGNGGIVAASNNGAGKKKGLVNNPTAQDDEFDFASNGSDDETVDEATLNQVVDIPFFIPEPEEAPVDPYEELEQDVDPVLPIEEEPFDNSMYMD